MENHSNPKGQAYTYDVFISYKHAALDSAVAGTLQKKLEHYRISRSLQKKIGKKKIQRVFRDNEELNAGRDLTTEIDHNLAGSEHLVVICSRASAQSPWVNREIRRFIDLHGPQNILPVLIDGEPDEAFPEALSLAGELLGVDLRAGLPKGYNMSSFHGNDPAGSTDNADIADRAGSTDTADTADSSNAADITDSGYDTSSSSAPMAYTPAHPDPADPETIRQVLKNLNKDLMRIVAPVLNLSYDDLKQRQKTYMYQRMMVAGGVLLGVLSAFLGYAFIQNGKLQTAYRETLFRESQSLTNQAKTELVNKDPISARRDLLEALPAADMDRPYYPEAERLLTEALGAYRTPKGTENELTVTGIITLPGKNKYPSIEVTPDGTRLLAFDSGKLLIYNTETLELEASLTLKDFSSLGHHWYPEEQKVILQNSSTVWCIDYSTAEICWESHLPSSLFRPVLSIPAGCMVGMAGDYYLKIDIRTGKIIDTVRNVFPEGVQSVSDYRSQALSVDGTRYFLKTESSFYVFDFNTREMSEISMEPVEGYTTGQSACWTDRDILIRHLAGEQSTEIRALDLNTQETLWKTNINVLFDSCTYHQLTLDGYHSSPMMMIATESYLLFLNVENGHYTRYKMKSAPKVYMVDGEDVTIVDENGQFYVVNANETTMQMPRWEFPIDYYDIVNTPGNDRMLFGFAADDGGRILRAELGVYDTEYVETDIFEKADYILASGEFAVISREDGNAVLSGDHLYMNIGDADNQELHLSLEDSYKSFLLGMNEQSVTLLRSDQIGEKESLVLGVPMSRTVYRNQILTINRATGSITSEEPEILKEHRIEDVAGTQIWYDTDQVGEYNLYDASTGETTTLTAPEGASTLPGLVLTGDRSLIPLVDTTELYLYLYDTAGEICSRIDLSTWTRSAVNQLDDNGIRISPDGSRIAVMRDDAVMIYNREGQLLRSVPRPDGSQSTSNPDMTFDTENRLYIICGDELLISEEGRTEDAVRLTLPKFETNSFANYHLKAYLAGEDIILTFLDQAVVLIHNGDTYDIKTGIGSVFFYDPHHDRMYTYDTSKEDEDINISCGYFPRYTLEDLIQKAGQEGGMNHE